MIDFNLIDWDWIENHKTSDPKLLTLKHGKDKRFEIIQIESRQRTAKKLCDTLRNNKFLFPSILSSMQATSDPLAKIHAEIIGNNKKILDMTCGLAIDSLHFAEKARYVTAIDINGDYIDIAQWNAANLGITNINFFTGDSVEWLKNYDGRFDAIYIDPARRDPNNRRCFDLKDCYPDVTAILPLLKEKTGKAVIKASPMLDTNAMIAQLPDITDIYAIGTVKECKEFLIVLDFDSVSEPTLHSITWTDRGTIDLKFPVKFISQSVYSDPEIGGYILLPYPSVMKIGHLDFLSAQTGINLIAPNTRLFYSHVKAIDFAGLAYRILNILPFDKQTIKEFRSIYPEINVTAKNFPLSASELAKKLKIKEGGTLRLFAVALNDQSKKLIVCDDG